MIARSNDPRWPPGVTKGHGFLFCVTEPLAQKSLGDVVGHLGCRAKATWVERLDSGNITGISKIPQPWVLMGIEPVG